MSKDWKKGEIVGLSEVMEGSIMMLFVSATYCTSALFLR